MANWIKKHIFVVVAALLFFAALARAYGERPVISLPDPGEISVSAAAPGGVAVLEGRLERLRGDGCTSSPAGSDTIVTDGAGLQYLINQRSGFVPSASPAGVYDLIIKMEIPRFAAPGVGSVRFERKFQCGIWTVDHRTPEYPVLILGDGQ